jgi:hypothetical protein
VSRGNLRTRAIGGFIAVIKAQAAEKTSML